MQAVADAHATLLRVHKELESLKRLSEVAVAAAAYGVERTETVIRNQRIVDRASSLQKVPLYQLSNSLQILRMLWVKKANSLGRGIKELAFLA